jgi:hypothetical protein
MASVRFDLTEIGGLAHIGEYLRLEFCSRAVHGRNASMRMARADVGRGLLAGRGAIAETLFSQLDSAKSCLMISAFSRFSTLLGLRPHVFANIASTGSAVTSPMSRILIIYAVRLVWGQSSGSRQDCALAGAPGCRLPKFLSRTRLCCVLVTRLGSPNRVTFILLRHSFCQGADDCFLNWRNIPSHSSSFAVGF